MKKLLIPAAILLGVSASAHAEFSVYGLLDVCYGKSIADDASNPKVDANFHSGGDEGSGVCNSTSRFGLKGNYDVGSGVKANFNLQSNGITGDGAVNNPFFGRQAWFGLSGGFGEFRLGRQDSVPFQTMIDFDFNGASNGVSAGAYTGVGPFNRGRQSRSLQYISPSLGGFTAQAGLTLKDKTVDVDNKDVFSLGLKFATGPIAAAVTYQSKSNANVKDEFKAVAGSYDFGVAKVMASYADGGKIADGGSGKGYELGVTAPVAGISIGAIYAHNSDDQAKAKAWELFVNKEIFKNTIAYAEYGNLKAKPTISDGEGGTITGDIKGNGFAVGLIYVF